MSDHYTDADVQAGAKAAFDIRDDIYDDEEWDEFSGDRELYQCQARAVLDAVAPAIAARAKAEAWDEAAEAVAEWMASNPSPSGIPHDPPRNPYADEIEEAQP